MNIELILQKEIEESKMWYDREKDDNTYKRDLQKRIELINWVLELSFSFFSSSSRITTKEIVK
jgi:hypothetical protein